MADSTMATMNKATKSRKQCFHCDALCVDSYSIQSTPLEDICMGRAPVATEQTRKYFCSNSCMKHYILTKELENLNKLLGCSTESAKRISEMLRGLKLRKERDLEHEEGVLMIWKSIQFNVKLYQACLDREPLQRLILLQAKSLQYLGEVLEHFHEDSGMLEITLKKIKVVQGLHLDILTS